jgi:hypothetical protein
MLSRLTLEELEPTNLSDVLETAATTTTTTRVQLFICVASLPFVK